MNYAVNYSKNASGCRNKQKSRMVINYFLVKTTFKKISFKNNEMQKGNV